MFGEEKCVENIQNTEILIKWLIGPFIKFNV